MSQNFVNHFVLVLDASPSMKGRERDLVKVANEQIAYWARRSQELNQETRVTVYTFHNTATCVVWDMDVLRLPDVGSFYRLGGSRTALIDATLKAHVDLSLTPQMYGDHAFLMYVFTDGQENNSTSTAEQLASVMRTLPENWTIGAFVPGLNEKTEAVRWGFSRDNVAVWDISSSTGVEEMGVQMRAATDTYMAGRAAGTRGTRTLFSTAADAVNAATIQAAGLKPLDAKAYNLVPVTKPRANQGVLNKDKARVWEISEFVKHATGSFTVGTVYFQLSKKERIQGNKALAVFEVKTGKVFVGDGVRDMIGLPNVETAVAPDFNPEYLIFVQSSSINRHLVAGTKLLVLKS